jgi:hypothetical protein
VSETKISEMTRSVLSDVRVMMIAVHVHTLNMVFIYLWMDRRTAPLSSSLPFLAAFPFAMIPTERPVAIAYLYSLLRAVPLARLCLVSINHESIKCF